MTPMFSIPPEKRRDPSVLNEIMSKSDETQKKIITDLMINRHKVEENMLKDLESTYNFLKANYNVHKMGVIGFCMGGGLTFQISTIKPFEASAVYYRANPKPIEAVANIKGAVPGDICGRRQQYKPGTA